MNKRQLHHLWKTFRLVKPWYFLVLALLFGVIALGALRANNQHMAELRDALYTADKENGDVQTALNNLQAYVTAHMNTSLSSGNTAVYPPIQLQYTYQRLVQAQSASQQSANGDLYTKAQAYCQSINSTDFSGRNRVPCIEKYVQDHGVQVATKTIDQNLYKFDFVAPKWSPDLAGWSLVLAVMFTLLALAKLIADHFIKRYVR
jgi:hypothetical protein